MSFGPRIINSFGKTSHLNFGAWNDQTDFKTEVQELCRTHKAKAGIWQRARCAKAILIGAPGVGKSSLVLKYCRDIFERNYKTTIGIDFEVEKYHILGVPFNLQIWDTAGAERFKGVTTAYFRGAVVIILAFDLTTEESLHRTGEWFREAKEFCQTDFYVFLVACKRDLVSDSWYERTEKMASLFAEEYSAEYWCTSSLTGENVELLFNRVAIVAFENVLMREIRVTSIPSNEQHVQHSTLLGVSCATASVTPKPTPQSLQSTQPEPLLHRAKKRIKSLFHRAPTIESSPLAGPSKLHDQGASNSAAQGKLGDRPTLRRLLKFPGREREINIPEKISTKYTEFAAFLLQDDDGSKVRNITHKYREDPVPINTEIFQQWLRGKGLHPVTWKTLIEVLRDIDLTTLAGDIESVLL